MSRAFRKEDDDKPEKPPSRPVAEGPNYVTAEGLRALEEALAAARAADDERNVAYYEERIASAELVDPSKNKKGVVAFGSTVTVRDEGGKDLTLRIVGEDEADPVHGTIGWHSPYAQALLDHRKGDKVVVQRPAGPATVVIESVRP